MTAIGGKLPLSLLRTDPGQAAVVRAWLDGHSLLVIANGFRFLGGATFQEQSETVRTAMEDFIARHAPGTLDLQFDGAAVMQAMTALARYVEKHPWCAGPAAASPNGTS